MPHSNGAIQSPTTNSAGGTHTITVIAVDGNGNQISYPSQTVTYSTPDGNQDVTTQGPNQIIIASGVDVGGEEWLPVTDSGGAGLSLSYRSTDSDVMAVMDSRADTGNNYEVLVKGVSFGQANIVATDSSGSIGQTGTFWDQPLSVTTSNSTSSEIEGGNYNSSNMPGFYFSTVYPSVTAINVQFNTDGSTLPSSLLGWLNSGSMTIPAGITRQFEAFTVSDDGKIAPTRGAVVNIEMRGDTYGRAGLTAVMDVTNTDVPGITVNGTQDGANLQLDRQNDPSLLATIGFRIEKDGTIVSSTLSWNPGQDVIWPTDKIGTVGTDDLASLPGATFDVNGAHYTWNGLPPAQLWDQAIGGSSSTDSTTITISVTVVKAATTVVPLASAAPFNTADKTQGGIWINVSGSGEQPDPDPTVDGDVVVGAGITLTIGYAGPDPLAQQGLFSDIGWTIPGATADPKTATAIANYTATPDKGVVTVLDAAALSSPIVHYYFLPDNQLNDVRTVSLNASDANFGYHASAKIRVITPDSTFNAVTTNDRPAVTVHNVPVLKNKLVLQLGTFYSSAGVKFFGSVTPPSTTSGSAYIIQLVSDYSAVASVGSMRFDSITDALDNPPAFYTVPNYGKTVTTPGGINTPLAFKFGNVTGPIDDSPDISLLPLDIFASRSFSAADYEMWQAGSPVTDSIPVPLRKLTWSFSATAVRIGLGSAAQDWLVISETCSFDGLPGGGLIQSVLAGPEPQWSLFAGNDTTVTVPYP